MRPVIHPDGSDDPRRAAEQFLDLVLGDEDLLLSEFQALVTSIAASTGSDESVPDDEGR